MKVILVGVEVKQDALLHKMIDILEHEIIMGSSEIINPKGVICVDSIPEDMPVKNIEMLYAKCEHVPPPIIDRTPPWKRKKYF